MPNGGQALRLEANGDYFLVSIFVRSRSNQAFAFAYSAPVPAANYVKIIKNLQEGMTGIAAVALYGFDVSASSLGFSWQSSL